MTVSNGDQPITAINLLPSNNLRVEGAGGEGAWSTRVSRGEDRRREVERKRAEKRELEAAKRKEMEERLRLEVQYTTIIMINCIIKSDDVWREGWVCWPPDCA